jgi:Flp pilus assembly pilin Flp
MSFCLRRFCCDERGAASIEYAFLLLLIALAIIAAVTALGAKVASSYANIAAGFN